MTKEDFIENNNIEDGTVILEPWEVFSKGIVGMTEDHTQLVYSYEKLQSALAEDYENEWNSKEHSPDEEVPDFYLDACEWLDYNTIRGLPYMGENRPIIIYEVEV